MHVITPDLIREARLRAGISQTELARRVGTSQPAVARWERGSVLPSLEMVRDIARACGLDLTFHLSRYDDSLITIVDQHLRASSAERHTHLLERLSFHDDLRRLQRREA